MSRSQASCLRFSVRRSCIHDERFPRLSSPAAPFTNVTVPQSAMTGRGLFFLRDGPLAFLPPPDRPKERPHRLEFLRADPFHASQLADIVKRPMRRPIGHDLPSQRFADLGKLRQLGPVRRNESDTLPKRMTPRLNRDRTWLFCCS